MSLSWVWRITASALSQASRVRRLSGQSDGLLQTHWLVQGGDTSLGFLAGAEFKFDVVFSFSDVFDSGLAAPLRLVNM